MRWRLLHGVKVDTYREFKEMPIDRRLDRDFGRHRYLQMKYAGFGTMSDEQITHYRLKMGYDD